MELQVIHFPIDQPVMPEGRQIGRAVCISNLENRLTTPVHQWLIGERRIGKTSVAKAALARLQNRGAVVVDVDLSKLQLSSTEELAGEIARQAQAAGAGNPPITKRVFGFAKRQQGQVKGLGKALDQLGFPDEGKALEAVSAVLAGADDGAPGLEEVLGALALHARATKSRVYVLIDEVHLLTDLQRAEAVIAKWCHEEESPVVFAFAGSEESAAQALREPGQPLAAIGEQFKLSEIAPEDWIPGLRERFQEAGIEIERAELEKLLGASKCHPRRTMLIASRIQTAAGMDPDGVATPTVVDLAIKDAEGDLSWR